MNIYWLRVIGPITGEILYAEYYYDVGFCVRVARIWAANGMNVETWSNYVQSGYELTWK